jgi:hypothetical protein
MFPKKWAIVELIVTWLVLYFVKLVVTQTTRKPLIHPPQIYQWKLDPVLKLDNTNSYIYGGWIAQEVFIVLIGIKDPPRVNSKGKPLYSNQICCVCKLRTCEASDSLLKSEASHARQVIPNWNLRHCTRAYFVWKIAWLVTSRARRPPHRFEIYFLDVLRFSTSWCLHFSSSW